MITFLLGKKEDYTKFLAGYYRWVLTIGPLRVGYFVRGGRHPTKPCLQLSWKENTRYFPDPRPKRGQLG